MTDPAPSLGPDGNQISPIYEEYGQFIAVDNFDIPVILIATQWSTPTACDSFQPPALIIWLTERWQFPGVWDWNVAKVRSMWSLLGQQNNKDNV